MVGAHTFADKIGLLPPLISGKFRCFSRGIVLVLVIMEKYSGFGFLQILLHAFCSVDLCYGFGFSRSVHGVQGNPIWGQFMLSSFCIFVLTGYR
jgi:hypothetical protein